MTERSTHHESSGALLRSLLAPMTLAAGLIFGGLCGLCCLPDALFIVDETENALLASPIRGEYFSVLEPGLHLKNPILEGVARLDKRVRLHDLEPNEIPTRDGDFVWVEAGVLWRVSDPILFKESVRDTSLAEARLRDIVDSIIRDEVSRASLTELIRSSSWQGEPADPKAHTGQTGPEDASSQGDNNTERPPSGREQLTARVQRKGEAALEVYGMELIDLRITYVSPNRPTQELMIERMIRVEEWRARH